MEGLITVKYIYINNVHSRHKSSWTKGSLSGKKLGTNYLWLDNRYKREETITDISFTSDTCLIKALPIVPAASLRSDLFSFSS